MKGLVAIPLPGKPPERVRRLTGRLAALFTAPGKMCVAYVGREHVYVRYGHGQWARVASDGVRPAPRPPRES